MIVLLMTITPFYVDYLSLYALTLHVVYTISNGVSVAIQEVVYAIGVGGQEGFYPT